MSVTEIPMVDAGNLANFFFQVELDGTTYQLTFHYNGRDSAWYMSISDTLGNDIRAGTKVVINWPLLRTVAVEGRPLGELIALDQRETVLEEPADPDLTALGTDVLMIYVAESSLPT